jgi:uncharacterized membrane protein YdjX (TVP38/TMEM64 family)
MNAKYKRLVIGVVVLSALVFTMRTFAKDIPNCADLQQKLQEWGYWAPVAFFVIYVVACVAFIPGTIVTLLAGLAFGAGWGTVLVSLASTTGAVLSFLIARYVARDAVEGFLGKQAWFNKFKASIEENGFNFMLFARLMPVFPFNGLNYASGLVPIKLKDYALASWIGMLPGTFVYVYLGATGCKLIDPIIAGGSLPPEDKMRTFMALGLLGLLSILPMVIKRFRKKT